MYAHAPPIAEDHLHMLCVANESLDDSPFEAEVGPFLRRKAQTPTSGFTLTCIDYAYVQALLSQQELLPTALRVPPAPGILAHATKSCRLWFSSSLTARPRNVLACKWG
jgi:hypothetical protein